MARILVVEDDALAARYLAQLVARFGHEVAGPAASGEEVLDLVRDEPPDLVLMDVRLRGEMDGTEAAARIAATNEDLPVVFLTAFGDEATMKRAAAAGPYGYLVKPVREEELRAAIEIAFERSRSRRENARLGRTLAAVREVGRVVARETDARAVVAGACRALSTNPDYACVRVALAAPPEADPPDVAVIGPEDADDGAPLGPCVLVEAALDAGKIRFERPDARREAHGRGCTATGSSGDTVAIPIRRGGGVRGVLCVALRRPGALDEAEVTLLEEVAADLAHALDALDADAARRRSELRYRSLFESARDALLLLDDGKVVAANRSAASLFGVAPVDLPGTAPFGEARGVASEALARVATGGEGEDFDWILRRRDGTPVFTEVRLDRAFSESGPVVQATIRDISERVAAERARREIEGRYRAIFASLEEGLLVLEASAPPGRGGGLRVVEANAAVERLCLLPVDMLLGRRLEQVLEGLGPAQLDAVERAAADGEPCRFELDAAQLGKALDVRAWPAGERRTAVLVTDVTSRLRQQERLRDAAAVLEEKVRERTAELERATTELQGFSYAMAHDLKQPLRAMDAHAALLAEELAGGLSPEQGRHLARIRAGASRMAVLTDGLVRMSRLAGLKPRRELLDLRPIADAVLARLREAEPARRVAVSLPDRAVVFADREMTTVALEALLENAWKFSSGRDGARIELGVEPREGAVVFFVRDDGVGFDPARAGRLFDPFQRLHRADEFPGEGIGLALAERAIRSQGGRIWAESRPGEGATFRFSLPLPDAGPRAGGTEAA